MADRWLPRSCRWLLSLCALIIGCQNKGIEHLPTPIATPVFLDDIQPAPSSVVPLDDYISRRESICVQLNALPLLRYRDEGIESEDYLERSTLIVDGNVWTQTEAKLIIDLLGLSKAHNMDPETGALIPDPETGLLIGTEYNAVGPFVICWNHVKLKEGLHSVEYQVHKTSGEQLSYSWVFYLVD
jgi:hypothetical protein